MTAESDNAEIAWSIVDDLMRLGGGVTALPVAKAALPLAGAGSADPIFTAIERHRNADTAFFARCEYEDQAGLGRNLDQTPEMKAAVEASIAARQELAETSPTTIAGLFAYVRYVEEYSRPDELIFDGEEEMFSFVGALGRSARLLARLS